MLSSISPLGERARGSRWGRTAAAYVVGSLTGGALMGAVAGWTGSLLAAAVSAPTWAGRAVLALSAVLLVVGLVLDLRVGGLKLPTVLRQVDENWMSRYRDWVYGAGYGLQLGLGVVTIVTSATVYAVLLLATVSASPAAGALLGAAFGLVRALPLLSLRRAHDLGAVHAVFDRVERWQASADRGAHLALGLSAAALAGAVVVL